MPNMPIRLAALGLMHESNTFAAQPTDLAAFQASAVLRSEDIWAQLATSHHAMAGFHDAHDSSLVVVEPLMFSEANPHGPITREAFEQLGDGMIDMLRERGPWDGVLMAQHGAAVSEEHVDADAELVRRARAVVGPNVPLGVALDLHGNLSRQVVDQSTVAIGYRTNPHGDARERAPGMRGVDDTHGPRRDRPCADVDTYPVGAPQPIHRSGAYADLLRSGARPCHEYAASALSNDHAGLSLRGRA